MYEIRNNCVISGADYTRREDKELYELLSRADSCERRIDDFAFIAGASDLATYESCVSALESRTDISEELQIALIDARNLIRKSKKTRFVGGVFMKGLVCIATSLCVFSSPGLSVIGFGLMVVGVLSLISSWVPQFAINEEVVSQGKPAPKIGVVIAIRAKLSAVSLGLV